MPASTDNEYVIAESTINFVVQRGLRYVFGMQGANGTNVDAVIAATPNRVFRYQDVRLKYETKMVNDWGGTEDSWVFKPAPVEKRASPIIEVDTTIPAH